MNKLLFCFSLALVISTADAVEISAYDQAVINGAGVPIANFTGKSEITVNDVNINRRDFGDCRDTWSCKKEDLVRYVKNNNGDVRIQPIETRPIKIPEPNTAALLALVVLGLGFRSLIKTNTKHKC